jgi:hypothetical protein
VASAQKAWRGAKGYFGSFGQIIAERLREKVQNTAQS